MNTVILIAYILAALFCLFSIVKLLTWRKYIEAAINTLCLIVIVMGLITRL